jgi:hypothetical protein
MTSSGKKISCRISKTSDGTQIVVRKLNISTEGLRGKMRLKGNSLQIGVDCRGTMQSCLVWRPDDHDVKYLISSNNIIKAEWLNRKATRETVMEVVRLSNKSVKSKQDSAVLKWCIDGFKNRLAARGLINYDAAIIRPEEKVIVEKIINESPGEFLSNITIKMSTFQTVTEFLTERDKEQVADEGAKLFGTTGYIDSMREFIREGMLEEILGRTNEEDEAVTEEPSLFSETSRDLRGTLRLSSYWDVYINEVLSRAGQHIFSTIQTAGLPTWMESKTIGQFCSICGIVGDTSIADDDF